MNARERYLQILRRFGFSEATIREVHAEAAGEDTSPASVARTAIEDSDAPTHERLARALAAGPHGIAVERDCWDHRLFAALETACAHHDHEFRYSLPDAPGADATIELVYKTDDGDGWLSTVPVPEGRVGPNGTPAAFHLLEGRLLARTDLTLVRLRAPDGVWRGVVVRRERLERLRAHYGERIDTFAEPLLPAVQPGDRAPVDGAVADGDDAAPAGGEGAPSATDAGSAGPETADGASVKSPAGAPAAGGPGTSEDATGDDEVAASTTTADGTDMTLHGGATTTAVSERSFDDEDLPSDRDFDAVETSYGVSRDRVEGDTTEDILSGLAGDRVDEPTLDVDEAEPGEEPPDAPDVEGFDFVEAEAEAELEGPFHEMLGTLEDDAADPDEVLEGFFAATPEDVVADGASQSALEAVHDALSDDREVEAFFEDSDLGTVDDDEPEGEADDGSLSDRVASILEPADDGDRGPLSTVDESASATFDGEGEAVAPETTEFQEVADAEEISFGEDELAAESEELDAETEEGGVFGVGGN